MFHEILCNTINLNRNKHDIANIGREVSSTVIDSQLQFRNRAVID